MAGATPAEPASGPAFGRLVVIAIPYLWLLAFFLVPFATVLKLSFSETAVAQPPYLPLAEWLDDAGQIYLQLRLNLSNYLLLVQDSLYFRAYVNSTVLPEPHDVDPPEIERR